MPGQVQSAIEHIGERADAEQRPELAMEIGRRHVYPGCDLGQARVSGEPLVHEG